MNLDRFAAKGAIYAKISITPTQSIHVFNTHLQSSSTTASLASIQSPATPNEALNDSNHSQVSSAVANDTPTIRLHQLAALKEFIDEVTKGSPNDPILLCGDMNVNSRQCKSTGKTHSEEYQTMCRILKGDVIVTGSRGNPLMSIHPVRLNLRDIIYEACGNEHPITFGDVMEPGKDPRPRETVLTSADGIGACGSIDYIFWMTDRHKDKEVAAAKSKGVSISQCTVDTKTTRVERFFVDNEPFTQMSGNGFLF
jgi:hypothetical protein